MARAIIELVEGRSLSARGRTLKKGYPQTITDAADIHYYQGIASVKVTSSEEPKPKVAKQPKVEAEIPKELPLAEPESKELEAEVPKVEKEKVEAAPDKPKKTKKVAAYSEDELKTKKKKVLIEIAASLGVYVDGSDKRKEIIAAILNVQNSEE